MDDKDDCETCGGWSAGRAAGGLLLLGVAAVIGYIGMDLLTGGWLTRMISGPPPAEGPASDPAPPAAGVPATVAGEVNEGDPS